MDGNQFEAQLKTLKACYLKLAGIFEQFDQVWPATEKEPMEELIRQCTVTKTSALLITAYAANQKKPNPSHLRRTVRKLRANVEDCSHMVQPALWEWSCKASTF